MGAELEDKADDDDVADLVTSLSSALNRYFSTSSEQKAEVGKAKSEYGRNGF